MNGGPSETVEVEALLATSILDADNVPNKNQSETCFSCRSKMVGLFCKDCGQKNDNLRRSIFFLGLEAFTSFFSLESRIWRTWLSLFVKPGHAAREFADGKRTLWTSPVRIYLAMSIILFGYMSLTGTRLISVHTELEPRSGVVGNIEDLHDTQIKLSPELFFFARQKKIDELNEDIDFERIERLIEGVPYAKFSLTKEEVSAITGLINSVEAGSNSYIGIDTPDDFDKDTLEKIEDAIEALEDQSNSTEKTQGEIDKDDKELANIKKRKAIEKLNRLLRNYPNMQDIAEGLSNKSLALSEANLINSLPNNLDDEKRESVAIEITEVMTELASSGITKDTISDLHLNLYDKSAIMLNSISLNGSKLNSNQTQQMTMKILRQPAVLNEAFATYLPRIMFLMMPFAMFAGIIFIRGKKTALMYDHLVHAAYIHAFTYLFLLVLIIMSQWTNITGLGKIFFFGILIYLPISAKRMFKRGWFKTFLASYSIAFQYSIVISFIMIGLLASQLNKTANII